MLVNKGITAGYFSHIFLVDASPTIEPDALIVLSNLANENTTVIVSGASYDHPRWIRSHIAKKNGLEMVYFERLCFSEAYRSCHPMFLFAAVNFHRINPIVVFHSPISIC